MFRETRSSKKMCVTKKNRVEIILHTLHVYLGRAATFTKNSEYNKLIYYILTKSTIYTFSDTQTNNATHIIRIRSLDHSEQYIDTTYIVVGRYIYIYITIIN